MKRKDPTIYSATFSGLNLSAFGLTQKLDGIYTVRVFQSRANPEVWKCLPNFQKGSLVWEAASAGELMQLIESNFDQCLNPWAVQPAPMPAGRSLRVAADVERRQKLT